MAFLGSIGKFFSQGPGGIIFPPIAIALNVIEAARSGEGVKGFIRREEAIYGIKPSSQAAQMGRVVTPEQTQFADTRLSGSQFGAFAYGGPAVSGSYFPGGDPWQTDLIYSAETSDLSRAEISSEILAAETYWGPEEYST